MAKLTFCLPVKLRRVVLELSTVVTLPVCAIVGLFIDHSWSAIVFLALSFVGAVTIVSILLSWICRLRMKAACVVFERLSDSQPSIGNASQFLIALLLLILAIMFPPSIVAYIVHLNSLLTGVELHDVITSHQSGMQLAVCLVLLFVSSTRVLSILTEGLWELLGVINPNSLCTEHPRVTFRRSYWRILSGYLSGLLLRRWGVVESAIIESLRAKSQSYWLAVIAAGYSTEEWSDLLGRRIRIHFRQCIASQNEVFAIIEVPLLCNLISKVVVVRMMLQYDAKGGDSHVGLRG